MTNIETFCKDCKAWSGSDCTRNPYTEGCLKDEQYEHLKTEFNKELDEHEAFTFKAMKRIETLKEELKMRIENAAVLIKVYQLQAIQDFAKQLNGEFIKSADNQEFQTTAKLLREVCPAKVNKILKKAEKKYRLK